jgi:hypothetical protein
MELKKMTAEEKRLRCQVVIMVVAVPLCKYDPNALRTKKVPRKVKTILSRRIFLTTRKPPITTNGSMYWFPIHHVAT